MCPVDNLSAIFAVERSCISGTASALVLLSTMRLRSAFNSGVTAGVYSPFDFFLILTFFVSRYLFCTGVPFLATTDFRRTGGECITTRGKERLDVVGRTGVRHLQQYVETMLAIMSSSNGRHRAGEKGCGAVQEPKSWSQIRVIQPAAFAAQLFRSASLKAALKILISAPALQETRRHRARHKAFHFPSL
jgi:hypothetical protein